MIRAGAAVLLALVLLGCGTRRTTTIVNRGDVAVTLVLEERYGGYDSPIPDPVPLAPGQSVVLWWDAAFENTVVVRRAGREVGRHTLPPDAEPLSVR